VRVVSDAKKQRRLTLHLTTSNFITG